MHILIDELFPTPELNFVEINEVVSSKINHSQDYQCWFTVLKTDGPTHNEFYMVRNDISDTYQVVLLSK